MKRTLGEEITRLRVKRGLSQLQLGDKCGFTRSYINMLERGKCHFRLVSTTAQKISASLDVQVSHWAPYTSDGQALALVAESLASQPPSLPITPEVEEWVGGVGGGDFAKGAAYVLTEAFQRATHAG